MDTKVKYEAPTLIEVGSFEEITKESSGGSSTDAAFPAFTPESDITFS